jgi:molybdate transport system permease protein
MTLVLGTEDYQAIFLSVKIATVASLCSLPFAVGLAYCLARYRFRGYMLVNVLVHLPLVLPPVVTGYGLLLLFGRYGPMGQFFETCCGLVFSFRWTGAALAAALMAFPLMVRTIRLSMEQVDQRLEQAAASLGAPASGIFLTITLPLAASGVVSGALIGFAKALGEFGATITFVANIPEQSRTIATSIYSYTQVPDGEGPALALAFISVALSVAALLLSEFLMRRANPQRKITP